MCARLGRLEVALVAPPDPGDLLIVLGSTPDTGVRESMSELGSISLYWRRRLADRPRTAAWQGWESTNTRTRYPLGRAA